MLGQEKVATGELSMEEMTLRVLQFQANLVEKLKADMAKVAEEKAEAVALAVTLKAVVTENAPKVDFYDDVAASDRTMTLSDAAKTLHMPVMAGIAWMREAGYPQRTSGKNKATSWAVEVLRAWGGSTTV